MTSLTAPALGLWRAFLAHVAAAGDDLVSRVAKPHRVLLRENATGRFDAFDAAQADSVLGHIDPQGRGDWAPELRAALKRARVELVLRADRFVTKELQLPAQAGSFLRQIVANQIDRFTPWPQEHALFGHAEAAQSDGRIAVHVAATDRRRVAPILDAVRRCDPGALSVFVEAGEQRIALLDGSPAGAATSRAAPQRALGAVFLLVCAVALVNQGYALWRTYQMRTEQEEIEAEIGRRRAALLRPGVMTDEGRAILNRKIAGPFATVLVDRLSQSLPDDTYLTDLEFDGSKLRMAGLSPDATRLIELLEHSGDFHDATFYAPTTRGGSSSRERFFIEAIVGRRIGEKS